MSNTRDFVLKEKSELGEVFTKLTYAINDVTPFLEESTLKKRKYVSKVSVLSEYMRMLSQAEAEPEKRGLFSLKRDNTVDKLLDYKQENIKTFYQLEDCANCKCLECIKDCEFKSCSGCRSGSYIKTCDKSDLDTRFHREFSLDLTNDNTGEENTYKVLATVENCKRDRLYIALENVHDVEDKLILYYFPGISGDEFGEITDFEEFEEVVQAVESM